LIILVVLQSVKFEPKTFWLAASDMGNEGEFVWCRAKSPPTRAVLDEAIFPNYWENNTQENDFVCASLTQPDYRGSTLKLRTAANNTLRHACMVKKNKASNTHFCNISQGVFLFVFAAIVKIFGAAICQIIFKDFFTFPESLLINEQYFYKKKPRVKCHSYFQIQLIRGKIFLPARFYVQKGDGIELKNFNEIFKNSSIFFRIKTKQYLCSSWGLFHSFKLPTKS